MPHFARPLALLLVVPLAWALWRWRVCRRPALRFSSIRHFTVTSPRARWARIGGVWLRGMGLTLLALAVCGVRWPDPGSRVPTEGISIALVVDASDSMSNVDFIHQGSKLLTRWQAVQTIARLFIKGGEDAGHRFAGRPHDLIALVTFAQRPETDSPLTLDHDSILALLEEEKPRRLQGTNPGDAIAWGLHFLAKAPTRRKVLLFLSDGEDNVRGDNLRPKQAALLAAAMDVPIYAIEIEPLPDESRPEEGKAARANMEMLAKVSGGTFFEAKDLEGMARAVEAIDKMERDRIESHEFRRYYDADAWFAAAALGVFSLLAALECTRWRANP